MTEANLQADGLVEEASPKGSGLVGDGRRGEFPP